MRSKFSLSQKLTYGLIALVAIGAVAEIGARLDDYFREGIPLTASPGYEALGTRDSLGAHGTPNGKFGDIRLNSAGFRSSEATLTVTPGCVRVMTIGSSETFGTGTTAGHEYPAQLQDSLSTHGCYRVINAAMVGMGLRSMIQYWNMYASRFRPDIVVVMATPSLYLQTAPMVFPKPMTTPRPNSGMQLDSRFFERVHDYIHYPDFIQRVRVQNHLDELTAGHKRDWFFTTIPQERLDQYRSDIDSIVTAIEAAGAKPVFSEYPTRMARPLSPDDSALMDAWRAYSPRATMDVMLDFLDAGNAAVAELGRRRQVPVVDLPSRMTGKPELFVDFSHYTAGGAAIVAGMVSHAIVDAYPPPARTTVSAAARE